MGCNFFNSSSLRKTPTGTTRAGTHGEVGDTAHEGRGSHAAARGSPIATRCAAELQLEALISWWICMCPLFPATRMFVLDCPRPQKKDYNRIGTARWASPERAARSLRGRTKIGSLFLFPSVMNRICRPDRFDFAADAPPPALVVFIVPTDEVLRDHTGPCRPARRFPIRESK
jgi:hypothetical protein